MLYLAVAPLPRERGWGEAKNKKPLNLAASGFLSTN